LRGGLNTYLYVKGNPVSRRDPRGLIGEDFPGAEALPFFPNEPLPSDPNAPYGDYLTNRMTREIKAEAKDIASLFPSTCQLGCVVVAYMSCSISHAELGPAVPFVCRQVASYVCNELVCKPKCP
jgi:hypothetical protein